LLGRAAKKDALRRCITTMGHRHVRVRRDPDRYAHLTVTQGETRRKVKVLFQFRGRARIENWRALTSCHPGVIAAWENCILGICPGKEAIMAETFQEWRQGAIEGLFLIAADTNQQQPQAQEMARRLAGFIAGAKFTIHIAIYDFRLVSATATPVLDALKERGQAGVTIRIAYHQDRQMAHFAAAEFARIGGDPAPPRGPATSWPLSMERGSRSNRSTGESI
jgi:hypothetical protein